MNVRGKGNVVVCAGKRPGCSDDCHHGKRHQPNDVGNGKLCTELGKCPDTGVKVCCAAAVARREKRAA